MLFFFSMGVGLMTIPIKFHFTSFVMSTMFSHESRDML